MELHILKLLLIHRIYYFQVLVLSQSQHLNQFSDDFINLRRNHRKVYLKKIFLCSLMLTFLQISSFLRNSSCHSSKIEIKGQVVISVSLRMFYKNSFLSCNNQNQNSGISQFSKNFYQTPEIPSSDYVGASSHAPTCYYRTPTSGCLGDSNKKHLLRYLKNRCSKNFKISRKVSGLIISKFIYADSSYQQFEAVEKF